MRSNSALLALAWVLLCGCSTVEGPAVSLVNLRLAEATAFETTAAFTLRLSNESPEPIQLEGGAYQIYLNGLYVGEGLTGELLDLPRLATVTQEVKVHLSNWRLATRIKPILESQCFDYRIKSVVYGRSPPRKMYSVNEGRLDLRDFQPTQSSPAPMPRP